MCGKHSSRVTVMFACSLPFSDNVSDLPKNGEVDESNSRCYRVTAMLLQPPPHCVLWVGLASGHMILFNATTRSPVVVVQRHQSDIRTIVDIRAKSEEGVVTLYTHAMQWATHTCGVVLCWGMSQNL